MASLTIIEPTLAEIRDIRIDRVRKKYTVEIAFKSAAGVVVTIQSFTFGYGATFDNIVDNFLTNTALPDILSAMGFA